MMNIMACFFIATTLTLLIYMITNVLTPSTLKDREKSTPYECGFEPKKSARLPFSLRFFLLAVIFLIFDVELALILPLPLITTTKTMLWAQLPATHVIIILLLGLIHEWYQGALNWTK